MTKGEKEQVKMAIRLIHHDNRYYTGLNILAKLVGWPEVRLPTKAVGLNDLLGGARNDKLAGRTFGEHSEPV